ncbi:type 1 glutamine amidotransferase [Methanomethylovorans sp.]|uniref:type 1 glutamine amidotransferase n=1 Tax=Methanomethylovorans sp. TaxID=2758717 RepID=UPI00351C4C59
MTVLIIKNCAREGPGTLGGILCSNGIEHDIFELEHAAEIPDPAKYEALIGMGGPASANDTTRAMQHEITRIEQAVIADVPYLGICLGMQALVKACGGRVIRNPIKEVGWKDLQGKSFSLELTPTGKKDAIFEGLEATLPIFHLHGETVELTDDMQLLATGKHCRNQVVKVGNNAYGFQGHLELTTSMLDTWLAEDDDLKQLPSEEVKRDHAAVREEYESNSKKVFTNFLRIAGIL